MINLFQIAGSDDSCSDLVTIFGSMNGVVCNPATPSVNATITAMFQTFNSAILAVAALVLVYTTVVGVMQTAHEGEFMGKKWNNIWIPIRMVLGIASLVPLGGGGYSLIQYVIMWVVVQGIGAADVLWATALTALKNNSLYAQAVVPSVGTSQTIGQIFQGLTCDATARLSYDNITNTPNADYYCKKNPDASICTTALAFSQETSTCNKTTCQFPLGPNGACGGIIYCDGTPTGNACSGSNSNSVACASCTGQYAALQKIIPPLAAVAQQTAITDYNYLAFNVTSYLFGMGLPLPQTMQFVGDYCSANGIASADCCVALSQTSIPGGIPLGLCTSNASFPDYLDNKNPAGASSDAVNNVYWPAIQNFIASNATVSSVLGTQPDFIDQASVVYAGIIQAAVTGAISQQNSGAVSTSLTTDSADGWLVAGAYYYYLAGQNNSNLQQSIPTLTMSSNNPDLTDSEMFNNRNNYNAAGFIVTDATNSSGSSASSPAASVMNSGISSASSSFQQNISAQGGSNPLSQLQSMGMGLIITAEIMYTVLLLLTIILGLAGFLDVFVLGTGVDNPIGPVTALSYFIILPAFFGLLGIMISVGGMLAVYTPLIPYIIFTFGVIGWLLGVIEAMIAGPLVALGIISPSGQHELLGKAEPALMLLFNVFLRPSLMIFGLMAAIYLSSVIVSMVNGAFWHVVQAIGGLGDPLTTLMFLGAYVMLIVSVLNKCFSAISIIPQQVMSWIGGHGQPGGAAGDAAEGIAAAKGGAEAVGSGAKGAGAEGRAHGEQAAKIKDSQNQDYKKRHPDGSDVT